MNAAENPNADTDGSKQAPPPDPLTWQKQKITLFTSWEAKAAPYDFWIGQPPRDDFWIVRIGQGGPPFAFFRTESLDAGQEGCADFVRTGTCPLPTFDWEAFRQEREKQSAERWAERQAEEAEQARFASPEAVARRVRVLREARRLAWEGDLSVAGLRGDEPGAEADGAALLAALVAPLDWTFFDTECGEVMWGAGKWVTEQRHYEFDIGVTPRFDLGTDDGGVPFDCLLSITEKEKTGKQVEFHGKMTDETKRRHRWSFPCRSVAEAKSLCERLVVTDDSAPVECRDACCYPLRWDTHPDKSKGQEAWAGSKCKGSEQYTVSVVGEGAGRTFAAACQVYARDEGSEVYAMRPLSQPPRPYPTEVAALAACERHHRAGEWYTGYT